LEALSKTLHRGTDLHLEEKEEDQCEGETKGERLRRMQWRIKNTLSPGGDDGQS